MLPRAAHDTNRPRRRQAPEVQKVRRFCSSQVSNRIERDRSGNDVEEPTLLPVPACGSAQRRHEAAHPQPAELARVGGGAPWLPPASPGHGGPHQSCGVQPRLHSAYDTQSGVGGASGGCGHSEDPPPHLSSPVHTVGGGLWRG